MIIKPKVQLNSCQQLIDILIKDPASLNVAQDRVPRNFMPTVFLLALREPLVSLSDFGSERSDSSGLNLAPSSPEQIHLSTSLRSKLSLNLTPRLLSLVKGKK